MSTRKRRTPASKPLPAEAALAILQPLKVRERIQAVAADVQSGARQFANIDTHELAQLLGVPQPDNPVDWDFCTCVQIQKLADYQDEGAFSSAAELADRLERYVESDRLARLRAACDDYDRGKRKSLAFLLSDERSYLVEQFARRELDRLRDNGIGGVATYCVGTGKNKLWFRGDIEEDGSCLSLCGPYHGVKGPDPREKDDDYLCS